MAKFALLRGEMPIACQTVGRRRQTVKMGSSIGGCTASSTAYCGAY